MYTKYAWASPLKKKSCIYITIGPNLILSDGRNPEENMG